MGSTKAAPVSPSPAGLLQGAVRGAEQAAPRQPRAPALPRGCPRLQGPGPVGALTRSPNAGWCQPAPPAHLWLSAVGPWAARGGGGGSSAQPHHPDADLAPAAACFRTASPAAAQVGRPRMAVEQAGPCAISGSDDPGKSCLLSGRAGCDGSLLLELFWRRK